MEPEGPFVSRDNVADSQQKLSEPAPEGDLASTLACEMPLSVAPGTSEGARMQVVEDLAREISNLYRSIYSAHSA